MTKRPMDWPLIEQQQQWRSQRNRAEELRKQTEKAEKPNQKLKPTEASALHRGSFASFNADDVMRVATMREGEGVKKREREGQSLTGFGLGIWHAAGNLR